MCVCITQSSLSQNRKSDFHSIRQFFFVYVSCCWFSYSLSSSLLLLLLHEFGVTIFSLFLSLSLFLFSFFSFFRSVGRIILLLFLSLASKNKYYYFFFFCCCHPKNLLFFFYLHFKNCRLVTKNSNLFSFSFFFCINVSSSNNLTFFSSSM